MSRLVSAPGKVMIIGEYAVLEGTECLVCALDRRLRVHYAPFVPSSVGIDHENTELQDELPPEVARSIHLAEQRYGLQPGHATVDRSELTAKDTKYGIGSSAAGAAASVAAVFSECGQDVSNETTRHAVFDLALQGHRAVAPHGSGADVAASVFGGALRYRRDSSRTSGAQIIPTRLSPTLSLCLVWTKKPARTDWFLERVHALKHTKPDVYQSCMSRLHEAAARFIDANKEHDTQGVLGSVRDYHDGMRKLGEAAQIPIVTDEIEAISTLAERFAGSSKPSGAGGGDLCVAFFAEKASALSFKNQVQAGGFVVVDAMLQAEGVRLDTNEDSR